MEFDGKILVADDDFRLCDLLKRSLEYEGFHVDIAGNGEEAVDIAKDPQIKLIIMDGLMPKLNGFEASKHIKRSINPEAKIILLTAVYTQARFRLKKARWGIDAIMTKPFDVHSLVDETKRLLQIAN